MKTKTQTNSCSFWSICLVALLSFSFSAHFDSEKLEPSQEEFPLLEELQKYVQHPVTTKNPQAQQFFNQGLTFIYAFNQEAAYLSFQQASKLDPQMAMAYWGMALAQGPILGTELPTHKEKTAYELMQKAQQLAPYASEEERAYIEALAQRYSNESELNYKQLAVNYNKAMQRLAMRYPDDLDAVTLFADSTLCLHADNLWKSNKESQAVSEEIVELLTSVFKRNPHHIGANHYYLHMMDDSQNPERALPQAYAFLDISPLLTHLVHMPSHIFIKVGDYARAIEVNQRSWAADQAYLQRFPKNQSYIDVVGHNLNFLVLSCTMAGDYKNAIQAADALQKAYIPYFKEQPEMEFYYETPLFVRIRFKRWQEILQIPKPSAEMKISTLLWHWGRGMAYANLGEENAAKQEISLLAKEKAGLSVEAKYAGVSANKVLDFLTLMLDAKLAEMHQQPTQAIQLLEKAVVTQDEFEGNDPFDWLFFARENLGGALLRDRQYAKAEQVFRKDLAQHRHNGRSLFGLYISLKEQSNLSAAYWIQQEWKESWKKSDSALSIDLL